MIATAEAKVTTGIWGRAGRAAPFIVAAVLAATAAVLWYKAIALSVDRLDGFSSEPREDMVAFYVAGKLLREGRAHQLYDLNVVAEEEARVLGRPAGYHGGLAYLNPPFVAGLFYPVSLLPYSLAQAVWLVIEITAIVIALLLLTPELRRLDRRWAAVFVLGVLASFPVFISILYVQLSPLVLLSWVVSYRLLRANRQYYGGLALAASLIKPPLAILPAILLLVTGKWRPFLAFAGAGLVLVLASVILVGPDTALGAYSRLALESANWRFEYGVDRPHMFGWNGFLSLVLDGRLPGLEKTLAIAGSLIAMLLAVNLCRRLRSQENEGRLLLVITAATVLVSPHIHVQDLVVFILPAAVLMAYGRSRSDILVPVVLLPLSAMTLAGVNVATPFLAGLLVYLTIKEAALSLRLGIPRPRLPAVKWPRSIPARPLFAGKARPITATLAPPRTR